MASCECRLHEFGIDFRCFIQVARYMSIGPYLRNCALNHFSVNYYFIGQAKAVREDSLRLLSSWLEDIRKIHIRDKS